MGIYMYHLKLSPPAHLLIPIRRGSIEGPSGSSIPSISSTKQPKSSFEQSQQRLFSCSCQVNQLGDERLRKISQQCYHLCMNQKAWWARQYCLTQNRSLGTQMLILCPEKCVYPFRLKALKLLAVNPSTSYMHFLLRCS